MRRLDDTVARGDLDAGATDAERRLSDVLDGYLSELEAGGIPPDVEALAAQHPDLADEIRSYAESLQLVHRMTTGLAPPSTAAPNQPTSPPSPSSARQLGDFVIVGEIGRGGMGVVYEARQLSLNRQVALKVLPFAAMLDEKQIARFRNEARAAALLHHPNIVPVYAIGEERGVHFFAMQLIAGQSLEAAINEMRLAEEVQKGPASLAPTIRWRKNAAEEDCEAALCDTTPDARFSTQAACRSRFHCRGAARLIQQAAEAIHHAHELGVIHRDVKPSNLLFDRDGKVWVTDFGLARIQAGTGVTMSGDMVGTLRYMSPEQVSGESALVDSRTDVYALGATLYELLTLRAVCPAQERHEILRQIETATPLAPRKLNPAVSADLETIVLRALAKSRDERYSTAKALADDLGRYLAGKPTVARPPGVVDRAVKWAGRRRRTAAVAALFLVTLTVVSAVGAILLSREQRRTADALADSEKNRQLAEKHFAQARDVVDRFGVGLAGELAAVPGTEPLRRQLLAATLDYYRDFMKQAAGQPSLERDMATASFKAATIAQTLGERDHALGEFEQAIDIFGRLAAAEPHDEELAAELARSRNGEAMLLAAGGDVAGARASYHRAIADLEGPLRAGLGGAAISALAETECNLGLLASMSGQKADARRWLTRAIALLERQAHDDGSPANRRALATAYNNLSFIERGFDWKKAAAASEKAIATLESLSAEDQLSAPQRADLALCYNNLGAIQGHLGHWADSVASHEKAILQQRKLVRLAPAVVSYRRELAASLNNLGQAHQAQDAAEPALVAFAEAGRIAAELAADFPQDLALRSLAGAIENNRAMALESMGKIDEAIVQYRGAVADQGAALDGAPDNADFREALSKHYFNLGRALRAAGKPEEAAEAALARRNLWPGHGEHLGQVAVELAEAAAQLGDAENSPGGRQRADQLRQEAAETLRAAVAAGCDVQKLERSGILRQLPGGSSQGAAAEGSGPRGDASPSTAAAVSSATAPAPAIHGS